VYLAFALHDLGKLDERWQRWAAEYQAAIGERRPDFLIAHTHWEQGNPLHEAAQRKVRSKKPKTHAGEGADAAARLLWEALNGRENSWLYKATFTAIARHHSPSLESANPYQLHTAAQDTLAETLAVIGEGSWGEWASWLRTSANDEPDLQRRLVQPFPADPLVCWWLYFLIVRNLRLCDGLSQEE